jgi:hypothetical protein
MFIGLKIENVPNQTCYVDTTMLFKTLHVK